MHVYTPKWEAPNEINDEINDLTFLCGMFMWYFMQDNSIVSRLYVLQ